MPTTPHGGPRPRHNSQQHDAPAGDGVGVNLLSATRMTSVTRVCNTLCTFTHTRYLLNHIHPEQTRRRKRPFLVNRPVFVGLTVALPFVDEESFVVHRVVRLLGPRHSSFIYIGPFATRSLGHRHTVLVEELVGVGRRPIRPCVH